MRAMQAAKETKQAAPTRAAPQRLALDQAWGAAAPEATRITALRRAAEAPRARAAGPVLGAARAAQAIHPVQAVPLARGSAQTAAATAPRGRGAARAAVVAAAPSPEGRRARIAVLGREAARATVAVAASGLAMPQARRALQVREVARIPAAVPVAVLDTVMLAVAVAAAPRPAANPALVVIQ